MHSSNLFVVVIVIIPLWLCLCLSWLMPQPKWSHSIRSFNWFLQQTRREPMLLLLPVDQQSSQPSTSPSTISLLEYRSKRGAVGICSSVSICRFVDRLTTLTLYLTLLKGLHCFCMCVRVCMFVTPDLLCVC